MIRKLDKAHTKFVLHFHYCPNFPPNVDFDQKKFAELLLRSERVPGTGRTTVVPGTGKRK